MGVPSFSAEQPRIWAEVGAPDPSPAYAFSLSPLFLRCGSRTGGPNTPGCWDSPGVKARESTLRPRTPEPAPLRLPLWALCSRGAPHSLGAVRSLGAPCSPGAQVSAAPLHPAPSESSQTQSPASPAAARPGGRLRVPRWSCLSRPRLLSPPPLQCGLRTPTPRISRQTLLCSLVSQSRYYPKTS